ncbi:Metacaspase type II [Mycena chlorophos]|uniref:Metacaspase type II n=1 Tax=Mycena chlorophos TaxID=658473 RepID=A0A8H6SRG6_MYCCL|nr:Metacaspase type II [Mycena chlorophos]
MPRSGRTWAKQIDLKDLPDRLSTPCFLEAAAVPEAVGVRLTTSFDNDMPPLTRATPSKRPALLPDIKIPVDSVAIASAPGSPSSSRNSIGPVAPSREPRQRALLIGIRGCPGPGFSELEGAHNDVLAMKELLVDLYGYKDADITILLDDEDERHLAPTRVNILKAIHELVEDAQSGDRFYFHYSGHSMQVPNESNTEEDHMDECLVPQDGQDARIVDDELHRALVAQLPQGSHLVAVLDTCHSGSLLDLKHYRCNRVYVPWIWRGYHKDLLDERRAHNVRRGARVPTIQEIFGSFDQPTAPLVPDTNEHASTSSCFPSLRDVAWMIMRRIRGWGIAERPPRHVIQQETPNGPEDAFVESPKPQYQCSGWCRKHEEVSDDLRVSDTVVANVISLASCKDSQQAWEGDGGKSMTTCLISLLRENQDRTLRELLLELSHAAYAISLARHRRTKKKRPKYVKWVNAARARISLGRRKADSIPEPETPPLSASPRGQTLPVQSARGPWNAFADVREYVDGLRRNLMMAYEKGGGDLDAFQNPELSSVRPLDMEGSYGYTDADITVLMDDGEHTLPTRDNILKAVQDLVDDAQAGDRFFFHYCGHSKQEPNKQNTEDDGMDECLVPHDGEKKRIVDNELYWRLVHPLPPGSHLVAVLDTCHSGSLLDLTHFRCNRVFVPWRYRRPSSKPEEPTQASRQSTAGSSTAPLISNDNHASACFPDLRELALQLFRSIHLRNVGLEVAPSLFLDGSAMCQSPTSDAPCTGWCSVPYPDEEVPVECMVKADVISLGSCRDSQLAWEGDNGKSITLCLVKLLRESQERTLRDVMFELSYEAYAIARKRHRRARRAHRKIARWVKGKLAKLAEWNRLRTRKAASIPAPEPPTPVSARAGTFPARFPARRKALNSLMREGAESTQKHVDTVKRNRGDTSEFQNPELSSPRPLDLTRRWCM